MGAVAHHPFCTFSIYIVALSNCFGNWPQHSKSQYAIIQLMKMYVMLKIISCEANVLQVQIVDV